MIYFIQVENNGPIKIGTAVDPEKRLNNLQIGNHKKLNLIAVIPGKSGLESKIHRDLKGFRRDGEWFNPTTEVLDYIRNIQFAEYEIQDGVPYAVLWRDTVVLGKTRTDLCPFCGQGHIHGVGDGHRGPHCYGEINRIARAKDGTVLEQENGYIVRTRNTVSE